VGSVADLFLNFHPEKRPILWRILVTQAHIYKALILLNQGLEDRIGGEVRPYGPDIAG
jgi:hypothetical protein